MHPAGGFPALIRFPSPDLHKTTSFLGIQASLRSHSRFFLSVQSASGGLGQRQAAAADRLKRGQRIGAAGPELRRRRASFRAPRSLWRSGGRRIRDNESVAVCPNAPGSSANRGIRVLAPAPDRGVRGIGRGFLLFWGGTGRSSVPFVGAARGCATADRWMKCCGVRASFFPLVVLVVGVAEVDLFFGAFVPVFFSICPLFTGPPCM